VGDACIAGVCASGVIQPDGTACSDHNPCTAGDRCLDGVCEAEDYPDCPCEQAAGGWTCTVGGGFCNAAADCEAQGLTPPICIEGAFECVDHVCRFECDVPVTDPDGDGLVGVDDDCPLDPANDEDGDTLCYQRYLVSLDYLTRHMSWTDEAPGIHGPQGATVLLDDLPTPTGVVPDFWAAAVSSAIRLPPSPSVPGRQMFLLHPLHDGQGLYFCQRGFGEYYLDNVRIWRLP